MQELGGGGRTAGATGQWSVHRRTGVLKPRPVAALLQSLAEAPSNMSPRGLSTRGDLAKSLCSRRGGPFPILLTCTTTSLPQNSTFSLKWDCKGYSGVLEASVACANLRSSFPRLSSLSLLGKEYAWPSPRCIPEGKSGVQQEAPPPQRRHSRPSGWRPWRFQDGERRR